MIKRLLSLLIVILVFQVSGWSESIKGSDGRITYIGRTSESDGAVSFDWTGVYLKVRFQGNSLSFNISDTHRNYFNVWIDRDMSSAPDKVISTHGNDSTVVIFSQEEMRASFGKDKKTMRAPHQVILQKRTEG
ncbi:MAG: hypothetical protein IJJ96_01610, partial [Bacteroidales bacterium]|nr:hypothetical protein [Bacteroidales bacterium]